MPVDLSDTSGRAGRDGRSSDGFALTGVHVLAMFIAFFVVVGGVNAIMLTQALRTMPGLDARNGYDVSQRYNAEIAAAAVQEARGWKVETGVAFKDGETLVTSRLRDRDGRVLDGLAVTAALRHPSDRRRDRQIALDAVGDGSYRGVLQEMTPGAWDLVVEARSHDGEARAYLSRRRIALKE